MKMNQAVKQEWVADLRSGAIHKGLCALRKSDRMCALGVLCNVHAKHHPEIAAQQSKKSEYMGERANLPKAVAKWAGLDSSNPELEFNGRDMSIIRLNDQENLTFKAIANLIEAQL